ncbi:hypothetical protein GOP47_0013355 [Adiantum capillus-veneris]|uniref:J domain-containing protein n=1 Tax=Adiantum capillus-veneris TaxID=13818 RepID=A0A9D4UND4_ADICA|nr:hypothetical protein GOP47_0013355 [Adiantum capillus-veneris]
MKKKQGCIIIFVLLLFGCCAEAKDLYKVLGVDKNASQREVQKAFHRLSLKYHPDKNPSKSAQAKFAEINNAYEVLSDEEKRKNYDLFGDEQGRARGPEPHEYGSNFHTRNDGGARNNFEFTTNDNNGYRFEQHSYTFGGEEGSHGQGDFFHFPTGNNFGGQGRSFSFGFGGNESPFQNILDSLFGSMGGNQGEEEHFTSYGAGGKTGKSSKSSKFQGGAHSSSLVEEFTVKSFQKKVLDELDTWAILFVPHVSNDVHERLQLLEQIAKNLKGCIKVGYVDCERQKQLCEQQRLIPLKMIKLRFYSLRSIGKMAALDYTGEWSANALKKYSIDVLPRFSTQLDNVVALMEAFEEESRPIAALLTKKKETPAIWRALSGLFYGRIVFFDIQVTDDDVDNTAKRFQVDSLPAIIGVYENGETKLLSHGSKLEQASSSIEQLKALLEDLEKKSKAAGPNKGKATVDSKVPSLTKKNFKDVCGQETPLCVIGVHRSSRGRDRLRQILQEISQKTLIRKGQRAGSSKKPISYGVIDGTKQSAFLNSFEKSLSERENSLLIAYKPKKDTYAFYDGPLNLETAEKFVIEILGGDLQLQRVVQDPVLQALHVVVHLAPSIQPAPLIRGFRSCCCI